MALRSNIGGTPVGQAGVQDLSVADAQSRGRQSPNVTQWKRQLSPVLDLAGIFRSGGLTGKFQSRGEAAEQAEPD